MKKLNKILLPKICAAAGGCLLLTGLFLLIWYQWTVHSSIQATQEVLQTLQMLMPQPQGAAPEERGDNTMPLIAVDDIDFIGILEIQAYDSVLPICAAWGNLEKYPCMFGGSVYDRTLQIGATSQKGQYDFYREISVGDTVVFTDAEGNRYTYTVQNLQYEKHADQTTLNQKDAALTLFIKNVYDFEYLIVSCL